MALTPSIPILIPKKSQEAIVQYHNSCYGLMNTQWNFRGQMRAIDLQYIREVDWTDEQRAAKWANSYGDADKIQNITVPVVMPQVETAVMYQTSVFLTGSPLFGVVADPANMDAAMQMETVIDAAAIRGSWKKELMKVVRDGFKYNLAAAEICWKREFAPTFETDLSYSATEGKPKQVIYEGPSLRHMDMYNTFFDPRVKPTEMHKYGEFSGYTEIMGRVRLKAFIASLGDKVMKENLPDAYASNIGGAPGTLTSALTQQYYIPPINPDSLLTAQSMQNFDWMQWAGVSGAGAPKLNYTNLYEITTIYARILPSDFGIRVPSANTAQIWKFIIVNHQVVVFAERLTNAHNYLPMIFTQPLEDGLGYQTKSLAMNNIPVQQVSSALMNSMIASRRRAISDRVLYDPSRITEAAINSPNPSAKIPVRPSAYGHNPAESVYAFPYREDQAGVSMQEIQMLSGFADRISGHNQAQQGQFVKGNKTREEFNTIMGNAGGRDQMCSILLEDQFFSPIKEILKIDILQYQNPTTLYSHAQDTNIAIDPAALRQSVLEFKISDGLIPSSKLIDGDTLGMAMQVIGSSPQIGAGYNLTQLFSYLMKIKGAHLKDFEKSPEQMAYEQALGAWQQTMEQRKEAITVAIKAAAEEPLPQILYQITKALPPQPTPQEFGYNPNPAMQVQRKPPQ